MSDLLLELYSEEIPARIQNRLIKEFDKLAIKSLEKEKINFSEVSSFITPNRVTFIIKGVPTNVTVEATERRGPKIDAPNQAIEGFIRSVNLESVNDLEQVNGYFVYKSPKKNIDISLVLIQQIENLIKDIGGSWPKSMYWGEHQIKWIRPLKNILCLLDDKVLDVTYGHLKANNKTRGHRFLSKEEGFFEVANADDYKQKLAENFVILDQEKRKYIITEEILKIVNNLKLKLIEDEALLNEVTGLAEYPVVLFGEIPKEFMDLPKEVMTTSMKYHQKYFSTEKNSGDLAPYFIFVSNMKTADSGKKIIEGNQKVLSARLSDAKFFYREDKKTRLEDRIEDLKKVVFHKELGSVHDKVTRVTALAKFLSVWVPHANLADVERAANLTKADLVTEMVGEFPELQGIMGSYYASEQGENEEVSCAVKEHYMPRDASDSAPKLPTSVAVAIADKIDNLVGLFAVGEAPTSSKDPFALRRSTVGVIKIILENQLYIPLKILFQKSLSLYPKSILKITIDDETQEKVKVRYNAVVDELLEFFSDRLKFLLKSEKIRLDLINSVFDDGREDDMLRLTLRVASLTKFVDSNEGKNLIAAYKRANNIITQTEKIEDAKIKKISKKLLKDDAEKNLFSKLKEIEPKITSLIKEDNYIDALRELETLAIPIDSFFEQVTVNDNNQSLRVNRLSLLTRNVELINKVANFAKISQAA